MTKMTNSSLPDAYSYLNFSLHSMCAVLAHTMFVKYMNLLMAGQYVKLNEIDTAIPNTSTDNDTCAYIRINSLLDSIS